MGIDATRSRSGGAVSHLRGLVKGLPQSHTADLKVHLWGYDSLIQEVSPQPWLIKHEVPATRLSLFWQLAWQFFCLPRLARQLGVEVIFNTDAGSVNPFQPSVTLSQDMLSFEPGEIDRFPWHSKQRLRLEILRLIQLWRLKKSTRALFLSEYAKTVISNLTALPPALIAPHGIDPRFFDARDRRRIWPNEGEVHCLYVSNAAPYKHQWHVVTAIAHLRASTGRDLRLRLVGGGEGAAWERLKAVIAKHDPDNRFVELIPFVPNARIVDILAEADLFVYASSCENLPVTLLEAMAAGLPIASSNRGPMPEVLETAAVFFDPENPATIAQAVLAIIENRELRLRIAEIARERAREYTWTRSADITWQALIESIPER